jgi:hypothetical protein
MTKETASQEKGNGMNQRSEDLLQVYKTLTFDVPLVGMRWAFGSANDKDSTLALWKGYDAGVRLATSSIDSLYRSQSLSEIVGNTVNQVLRIQQLTNAASKLLMTGLAQPLALPGTVEAQPATAPVDMRSSDTRAAQTPAATTRRSRKRRPQTQEPVPTPAFPFPGHTGLRVAA